MHSSLAEMSYNGPRCTLGIGHNRLTSVDFDDLGVMSEGFWPFDIDSGPHEAVEGRLPFPIMR